MLNLRMQKMGEERSAIRELFEYGNARKREIGEENVFDFSIGNPSVPAPAVVNETASRLMKELPPERLHGYTSAAGDFAVREKVAAFLHTKFGAPMSAPLVYMTCGAAASLTISLSALCNAGDEVVVLTPYFPEYRVFIESAGATVVEVPTDERFHLSLPALSEALTKKTKAVLVNSPNNPTGAVYSEEEMRALASLLRRKSTEYGKTIFLLADEPYRELCYVEPPVFPMNVYEHTIVLYSFSKSLSLAGERIGYIAVSPRCDHAEDVFSAVCGAGRCLGYVCAPSLFQRVVAECLGQSSDITEYEKNRDLLYHALCSYGYECVAPEGAFYLFVKALEPDAKAFCERAKKHELLLVPSDSFGVKGYVRISYCVARKTIERSLPAFQALMKEYRGE